MCVLVCVRARACVDCVGGEMEWDGEAFLGEAEQKCEGRKRDGVRETGWRKKEGM